MDKYAVISMDVEDWYHTYFPEENVDKDVSLLDGLDVALEIMDKKRIKGSFFVVGEIADNLSEKLRNMDRSGHDIGCHSWLHLRPVSMSLFDFRNQLVASKEKLEMVLGHTVSGYRAPSFGIDDARFKVVEEMFEYDSSRIKPQKSSKYGKIDLDGFEEISSNVYKRGDFIEFEVSTQKFYNWNILLGGGYIRMLPWFFMKNLTKSYLSTGQTYVLYTHPIDFSLKPIPTVSKWSLDRFLRTHIGRKSMASRFESVITMLESAGYKFVTFKQYRQQLLHNGQ